MYIHINEAAESSASMGVTLATQSWAVPTGTGTSRKAPNMQFGQLSPSGQLKPTHSGTDGFPLQFNRWQD